MHGKCCRDVCTALASPGFFTVVCSKRKQMTDLIRVEGWTCTICTRWTSWLKDAVFPWVLHRRVVGGIPLPHHSPLQEPQRNPQLDMSLSVFSTPYGSSPPVWQGLFSPKWSSSHLYLAAGSCFDLFPVRKQFHWHHFPENQVFIYIFSVISHWYSKKKML